MKINIAICDDEPLQVKINGMYLKDIAERNRLDLTISGFTNLSSLNNFISCNDVDIVFMDIDLGDTSGIKGAIDLFKSKPNLLVIFITGHREFAYEAFDMEAMGYILKPVDISKLEHTLKKAIHQIEERTKQQSEHYLVFTVDKVKIRVAEKDILSLERNRTHVLITTPSESYRVYDSITNLSEQLGNNFVRINQSEIVNIAEIENIKGYSLFTKHGEEKTISRKFKKDVLKAFFQI